MPASLLILALAETGIDANKPVCSEKDRRTLFAAVHASRVPIRDSVVAIVIPACGLLWLGVLSFERHRQALTTPTRENWKSSWKLRGTAVEQALARPI